MPPIEKELVPDLQLAFTAPVDNRDYGQAHSFTSERNYADLHSPSNR